MSIIPILAAGFSAGAVHVLIGPDHLAAIAPLAVQPRRHPWVLGIRWGSGHASGVGLVAASAWFFREVLPVDALSEISERLVGVMLVAIGLWGLRKSVRLHVHEHRVHEHRAHAHTALAVGVLHGLAGASHFFGVLPALAMPTRATAAIYLLCFAAGTILAMGAFSTVCGFIGNSAERSWQDGSLFRGTRMLRLATSFTAVTAVGVGIFWLL